MRIAIQGEPGSNSHLAVQALLGPANAHSPARSRHRSFSSLPPRITPPAPAAADAAVLPIENSLHGAVADHYDLPPAT